MEQMRRSICTAVHQLSDDDDCHDGQADGNGDDDDADGVDDDSYDEEEE